MSASLKIRVACSRCRGTGLDDNGSDGQGVPTSVPCLSCGQTGLLMSGEVDGSEMFDDIIARLKRIEKKLGPKPVEVSEEIKEEVTP